jgi:dipeptidyl aminopeptidase/acylaminoacyl peptidase
VVHPLTPETLIYDIATAAEPQISPDGRRIVYALGQAVRGKKQPSSQLWMCNLDGSNARRLTWIGDRNAMPRWSPDGQRLAFVSDRVKQRGLFVLDLDGGEAREITRHNVPIGEIAWSPDGQRLAYVANFDPDNPDERDPAPDEPPRVRVTRRIDYKQDNRGYLEDVRPQLWIVDAGTGERRMVTREAVDHAFPQWSPDGATIAVKIAHRNGLTSQLGLVDVATGEVQRVGNDEGVVGCWAWSPDGSRLLIAGDTAQTWQLDLFVYDLASRELRRLTDDLFCQPDAGFPTVVGPSQPVWLDNRRAIFHAIEHGMSGLYSVDTETGAVERITQWQGLHTGLSVDAARSVAVQAQSSLEGTGEVIVTDLHTLQSRVITAHNQELFAAAPPAAWERFDVQRGDVTIEAWLLKPYGWEPGKRYPLVLDIHGGPNSWYGYGFNAVQQALAGAGFFVLFTNPRGSGSYGRAFTQQVIRDWGGEDYLDLMAAVDHACQRDDVDPSRLGVYGYSYGGFMSSWIIGHTDRFAAAVIGAPVVNLVSFYGTADIGWIFGPLQIGGTPDECPEEYRFRSPLTYLDRARTPTLILHGEADDRVPIGQGEELVVALKQAGCPVEFVRYPEGSHAMLRTGYPAHRRDYLERVVGWFRKHLGTSDR